MFAQIENLESRRLLSVSTSGVMLPVLVPLIDDGGAPVVAIPTNSGTASTDGTDAGSTSTIATSTTTSPATDPSNPGTTTDGTATSVPTDTTATDTTTGDPTSLDSSGDGTDATASGDATDGNSDGDSLDDGTGDSGTGDNGTAVADAGDNTTDDSGATSDGSDDGSNLDGGIADTTDGGLLDGSTVATTSIGLTFSPVFVLGSVAPVDLTTLRATGNASSPSRASDSTSLLSQSSSVSSIASIKPVDGNIFNGTNLGGFGPNGISSDSIVGGNGLDGVVQLSPLPAAPTSNSINVSLPVASPTLSSAVSANESSDVLSYLDQPTVAPSSNPNIGIPDTSSPTVLANATGSPAAKQSQPVAAVNAVSVQPASSIPAVATSASDRNESLDAHAIRSTAANTPVNFANVGFSDRMISTPPASPITASLPMMRDVALAPAKPSAVVHNGAALLLVALPLRKPINSRRSNRRDKNRVASTI